MTIREAKIIGLKKLKRASGNEAAIDAEILLAHVLKISREELLMHDERRVPAFALAEFNALIARRAKHEPVAYLTGHKEFYGLQFAVNQHVLIPRPETELLVEEALKIINANADGTPPNSAKATLGRPSPSFPKRELDTTPPFGKGRVGRVPVVIDVGTGSGAIAVAIAKNAPDAVVIATDISKAALKTAALNAITNDVGDQIIFERADLLGFKNGRPTIFETAVITANLPYLPTKVWQKAMPDVKKFEPKSALVGGQDGLKYYDELFHQIVERNIKAKIICEIDPSQKRSFPRLAKRHFPGAAVEIKNDLAGLPRMAIVTEN